MSIQALLYRARELGCLSEVSYRNAMGTVTAKGWRRNEPGVITHGEQPSLLAKATEMLAREGYTSETLAGEGGAPERLFDIVTARRPAAGSTLPAADQDGVGARGADVVSLFGQTRGPREA